MITTHVNLVLRITDGFTGKPLVKSALRAYVDGELYHPEYRAGGYFVFINLLDGRHDITLDGIRFQRETFAFNARSDGREERAIALKPDASYPFGRAITRLNCALVQKGAPLAGVRICVAATAEGEIKVAQDAIEAGETQGKLYTRGKSGEIEPGPYLIVDGRNSEICEITSYADGTGTFAPLGCAHKRGKAMYPAAIYTTDASGRFFASFKRATPVELFALDARKPFSAELKEGENALTLEL